ncbi:wax ester/triacylglycerol synthase domain-containing protein [Pseudonocardia sp.]|uniref:wax ester/triacylglycerol synthase domain-containing protein n=1 Tax=Pseudonocardia sp. TaxID=60912 RepID=UPI003D101D0C
MGAARVHRLRPADLANLWAEGPGSPSQIALVAEFAAGPLTTPGGRPDLPRIRAELARRAAAVPALTRRVRWTRPGEGLPVWVADPAPDPAGRIGTASLPEGADLVGWCADRVVVPLDRDGPLWRAEIVDGLPGDRFGLLVVLHHVLADGLAGVALAARLLDGAPGEDGGGVAKPDAPAGGRRPATAAGGAGGPAVEGGTGGVAEPAVEGGTGGVAEPAVADSTEPTRRALVADAWRTRLHSARAALARLPQLPAGLRRAVRSLAGTAGELRHPAPRTSLPRHLGPHRRLAAVRVPLSEVRAAGHAAGATVNDIVLSAVAAGLRAHFTARGERVDGLTLPVSMPVARGGGRPGGMVLVGLPVGEPDPRRRLAAIVTATSAAKRRLRDGDGDLFDVLRLPVPVARAAVRWLRGRAARYVTLVVTDVPGPPQPLWLAGARMLDAVGVAPLSADIALGVAVLSYAGTLAVTVNADAAIGSLDAFVGGIAAELGHLGGPGAAPHR